ESSLADATPKTTAGRSTMWTARRDRRRRPHRPRIRLGALRLGGAAVALVCRPGWCYGGGAMPAHPPQVLWARRRGGLVNIEPLGWELSQCHNEQIPFKN